MARMTGFTRKRWSPEEDAIFLQEYNALVKLGKGEESIYKNLLAREEYKGRTKRALQQRHYDLTRGRLRQEQSEPKAQQHSDFLEGLQDLKNSYETVYTHNVQLRKRIEELETQLQDYQMMARIMEQARKIIVAEELGPSEKPRFKMDQNGNLERQR